MTLSREEQIATDFATIEFPDHEARILALGYFALKRKLDAAEQRVTECEAYAKEGWDWLNEALEALGVKTVFDIEDAKQRAEQAEADAERWETAYHALQRKCDERERALAQHEGKA